MGLHAIEYKLDQGFGKENLKKRALPYIEKKYFEGFRANILTSKKAFDGLGLNTEGFFHKAVEVNKEIQSKKEDIKNALIGTGKNQDGWHHIRSYIDTWVGEHCYKRGEGYRVNPAIEKKYHEITAGFSLEATLFNKVYEMMCIDLILAHAREKNPTYDIQVYKTSTYDDVMSGIDAILVATDTDKRTQKKKTFFLDILTSENENSHYAKNDKGGDVIQCYEFSSAVGRSIYGKKDDKIIYTLHPELAFMTFNTYMKSIIENGGITPSDTLSVYRDLYAQHQEYNTIDNENVIPIISSTLQTRVA